jgi:hypothetical protein
MKRFILCRASGALASLVSLSCVASAALFIAPVQASPSEAEIRAALALGEAIGEHCIAQIEGGAWLPPHNTKSMAAIEAAYTLAFESCTDYHLDRLFP